MSYEAAEKKKRGFIKRNNMRQAECCQHCYHSSESGYFTDRVECSQLIWEVGNDVAPTDVCNQFVRRG